MSDFTRPAVLVDQAEFERPLREQFPLIAESIAECAVGLLHFEMGALAQATSEAIKADDFTTVARHFAFVEELFQNAAPDVENAVYVSYLENVFLFIKEPRFLTARAALPERLAVALVELEQHFEELARWARERDGLACPDRTTSR